MRQLDSFVDISEEDLLLLIDLLRHPANQIPASRAEALAKFPVIDSKRLTQD